MTWIWLFILAQVVAGGADDGADQGRRGAALYESGQFAEAESAFREGLSAASDTTSAVYAALQHNLGAALYRQKKFGPARRAFTRAVRVAPSDAERVRALFNAGNAAAGAGDLDAALASYRRALRIDPTHDDARFNYEMVTRKMAERQPRRNEPDPDVDPSPFAKRLKRQADVLAANHRYAAALRVMNDGMERDSTVAAYRGFISRLQDVNRIDRGASSSSGGPSLQTVPDTPDNQSFQP